MVQWLVQWLGHLAHECSGLQATLRTSLAIFHPLYGLDQTRDPITIFQLGFILATRSFFNSKQSTFMDSDLTDRSNNIRQRITQLRDSL